MNTVGEQPFSRIVAIIVATYAQDAHRLRMDKLTTPAKRTARNLFLLSGLVEIGTVMAQNDVRLRSFSQLVEKLLTSHIRQNPDKVKSACRAKGMRFPAEMFVKGGAQS